MSNPSDFSFSDDSVAKAYDQILVPPIFKPWAQQLISENQPWSGKRVLDLACGTGVLTKELVKNVDGTGKVIAMDINKQMLSLAMSNCMDWESQIVFAEGSCEAIPISNDDLDVVVCQQGFQFFPDKIKAAIEIHRVLKPDGKAILSTWCSVNECEIFGAICEALEKSDLNEIAQLMRVPFDFLTTEELFNPFNNAGFRSISTEKKEKELLLEGGLESTLSFAYATPIGPKLKSLSRKKQEEFKERYFEKIEALRRNSNIFGKMVSNVLTCLK